MKVTLIEHPRQSSAERSNDIANTTLSSCLNSGYAAAVLEMAGHTVEVLEGYMEHLSYDNLFDALKEDVPDVIGIHAVYNWDDSGDLITFIKRIKEDLHVPLMTAYGYYPTFYAEELLRACPELDGILCGEIERSFPELLSHIDDISDVTGVAYLDDEGVFHQTYGPVTTDLDTLPFPRRTASNIPGGQANILGSRGCYGNCTFCFINPYYGITTKSGKRRALWRPRSPQNIAREIETIKKDLGINYFYFTDPNFYGPGEEGRLRVLELAEVLKKLHIRFGIEARANDIEPESIKALVDAGLLDILIGLESGRDESLKRLGKFTSVSDNERALSVLREAGIDPAVGFIMFEPDSSLEDLAVNLDFLKRNKLLDKLERTINVLYHHQIILKGSPSYTMLKAEGRLHFPDYSEFEATTPYERSETAALAETMRLITNAFFVYMKDSWIAQAQGDPVECKIYDAVNSLLIDTFENCLKDLTDNGMKEYDPLERAKDAVHTMNQILMDAKGDLITPLCVER